MIIIERYQDGEWIETAFNQGSSRTGSDQGNVNMLKTMALAMRQAEMPVRLKDVSKQTRVNTHTYVPADNSFCIHWSLESPMNEDFDDFPVVLRLSSYGDLLETFPTLPDNDFGKWAKKITETRPFDCLNGAFGEKSRKAGVVVRKYNRVVPKVIPPKGTRIFHRLVREGLIKESGRW